MRILYLMLLATSLVGCSDEEKYVEALDSKVEIGSAIFKDATLSNPVGQSCATCHAPEHGFSDSVERAVSEGATEELFSNRNAPALSYNIFSPRRYYDATDNTYVGGLFLDGRSNNLREQFLNPLLNPVEMNNSSVAAVADKIREASYYVELVQVYGEAVSDEQLMSFAADAVATFETSDKVNPFTSKYDYYLQGRATLSLQEKKGMVIFEVKGKCAQCHVTEPDPIQRKVLFTDFTYDNIGVPANQNNPFYNQSLSVNPLGNNYIDLGIGAIVSQSNHYGKFRVPSLRNIERSAPYFHNGSFQSLEEVVRFYNKRDVLPNNFAPPEVAQNVNHTELGNLNLSDEESENLVAFLKTLNDGYHKP